jgi:hypothetical protein
MECRRTGPWEAGGLEQLKQRGWARAGGGLGKGNRRAGLGGNRMIGPRGAGGLGHGEQVLGQQEQTDWAMGSRNAGPMGQDFVSWVEGGLGRGSGDLAMGSWDRARGAEAGPEGAVTGPGEQRWARGSKDLDRGARN